MASIAPSAAELLFRWFDQGHDYAIIFMAPDARVLSINPAAERLLGYRSDELAGDTLQRIFTPEDLARGLDRHELSLAAETGRSEDDRWHVGKGGRRIWVSGVLMALRDAEGRQVGFAKTMRDRTDLRAQIETLENRSKADAAALLDQSRSLAMIGHELRNPLGTLVNAFAVLRQGSISPEKMFAVIDRQLATLQRLLDDLRDSSRQLGPKTELKLVDVNLQAAIHGAVALHEPAAQARNQVLKTVVPGPIIHLQADPIRLEQILRNLLDNAIKYTPDMGVITVSATVEGTTAVVRVEDQGMGISAEMLPNVFELFTRESRAVESRVVGMGVGLAVVRDLVSLHHGIIEVQSAGKDRGTEFTVRLPLLAPAASSPAG